MTPDADRRGADPALLMARIGYRFRDPELLAQALRHRSCQVTPAAGQPPLPHNERLEFLGDAILDLLVSAMLFVRFPEAREGQLSRWRAALVKTSALARVARDVNLGDYLSMGRGEALSGGRLKKSLLGDALEALVGAVYLDGGHAAARAVVETLFAHLVAAIDPGEGAKDYKTALQERLQSLGLPLPHYRLLAVAGPEHQRFFTVVCRAAGQPDSQGAGTSKKRAEVEAARAMLMAWIGTTGEGEES
ncbi:MAG: ribonuclease III [Magnetococcales bacterium]|nr:ribonuclease III [Magnetococcales bacterium]